MLVVTLAHASKCFVRRFLSAAQRSAILDDYFTHLVVVWYDRAMDANGAELSRMCRRLLVDGQMLIKLARQFSFWLLRADGVDQAKFRVPRHTTKTHAFEKLMLPALHVQ